MCVSGGISKRNLSLKIKIQTCYKTLRDASCYEGRELSRVDHCVVSVHKINDEV